jgi:hypothetical protein
MRSMIKDMVRRAPPPGALSVGKDDGDDYGGGEEAESEDEDAGEAVAQSAYEDFARLAGFKPSAETFAAFREAVRAVK